MVEEERTLGDSEFATPTLVLSQSERRSRLTSRTPLVLRAAGVLATVEELVRVAGDPSREQEEQKDVNDAMEEEVNEDAGAKQGDEEGEQDASIVTVTDSCSGDCVDAGVHAAERSRPVVTVALVVTSAV